MRAHFSLRAVPSEQARSFYSQNGARQLLSCTWFDSVSAYHIFRFHVLFTPSGCGVIGCNAHTNQSLKAAEPDLATRWPSQAWAVYFFYPVSGLSSVTKVKYFRGNGAGLRDILGLLSQASPDLRLGGAPQCSVPMSELQSQSVGIVTA